MPLLSTNASSTHTFRSPVPRGDAGLLVQHVACVLVGLHVFIEHHHVTFANEIGYGTKRFVDLCNLEGQALLIALYRSEIAVVLRFWIPPILESLTFE